MEDRDSDHRRGALRRGVDSPPRYRDEPRRRNAEILWKGLNDPSALTEADFFVFDLLMHRQFNVLVETHRNLEAGMASQNWASSVGEEYRSIFAAKPGGRAWLREHMGTDEGAAKLLGPIE